jgi:RHS repeat-associated protein
VLEEIENGAVVRRYTYGLDLVSQEQASGVSFYGYDGHGSVRLLTDAVGGITSNYVYDAWGNVISRLTPTENAYLYSGEFSDELLERYHLRARLYNSYTGRFEVRDQFEGVLTQPRTMQPYVYANADPVNGMDPTGQYTFIELAIANANLALLQEHYLVMVSTTFLNTVPIVCSMEPAVRIREAALKAIASGGGVGAFDLERKAREMISRGATLTALGIAKGYYDMGMRLADKAKIPWMGRERGLGEILVGIDPELRKRIGDVQQDIRDYVEQARLAFNTADAENCKAFAKAADLIEGVVEITQESIDVIGKLEDLGFFAP